MHGEQKLFAFTFQKPLPARAESSLLKAPGYEKPEKMTDSKPEASVDTSDVHFLLLVLGVPPEFSSFVGS